MTRSEKIQVLRKMGMSPTAEKELKALWQCHIQWRLAKTERARRQQEYRWAKIKKEVMGVGYYWYQIAMREGLD